MSTTKHTPGPWVVDKPFPNGANLYVCANDENKESFYVAVMPLYDEHLRVQRDANANLIAAAPELLAALDLFVTLHKQPTSFKSDFRNALIIAEKAMAKAGHVNDIDGF